MKLGEYIKELREYWYGGQIAIAVRYENERRCVGTKKKPCSFVFELEKYHPELLDKEVIKKLEYWGHPDFEALNLKSVEVWIK